MNVEGKRDNLDANSEDERANPVAKYREDATTSPTRPSPIATPSIQPPLAIRGDPFVATLTRDTRAIVAHGRPPARRGGEGRAAREVGEGRTDDTIRGESRGDGGDSWSTKGSFINLI